MRRRRDDKKAMRREMCATSLLIWSGHLEERQWRNVRRRTPCSGARRQRVLTHQGARIMALPFACSVLSTQSLGGITFACRVESESALLVMVTGKDIWPCLAPRRLAPHLLNSE